MKFVTVSELRLRATEIVREIDSTKEEVIVTKNGKPVVLMRFISDEAFSLKETEKVKEVKHTQSKENKLAT
jgi:PHD/YefM family antitoxin component YafN of YafNO toxin-antitoxin module